jgi:hypothetical protein
MDDVDALERLDLGEVEAEGFERALEFAFGAFGDLGSMAPRRARGGCLHRSAAAPAMDFDFDFFASSRLR